MLFILDECIWSNTLICGSYWSGGGGGDIDGGGGGEGNKLEKEEVKKEKIWSRIQAGLVLFEMEMWSLTAHSDTHNSALGLCTEALTCCHPGRTQQALTMKPDRWAVREQEPVCHCPNCPLGSLKGGQNRACQLRRTPETQLCGSIQRKQGSSFHQITPGGIYLLMLGWALQVPRWLWHCPGPRGDYVLMFTTEGDNISNMCFTTWVGNVSLQHWWRKCD